MAHRHDKAQQFLVCLLEIVEVSLSKFPCFDSVTRDVAHHPFGVPSQAMRQWRYACEDHKHVSVHSIAQIADGRCSPPLRKRKHRHFSLGASGSIPAAKCGRSAVVRVATPTTLPRSQCLGTDESFGFLVPNLEQGFAEIGSLLLERPDLQRQGKLRFVVAGSAVILHWLSCRSDSRAFM